MSLKWLVGKLWDNIDRLAAAAAVAALSHSIFVSLLTHFGHVSNTYILKKRGKREERTEETFNTFSFPSCYGPRYVHNQPLFGRMDAIKEMCITVAEKGEVL